jgi:GIY-YIG catalytic domain-containing protein
MAFIYSIAHPHTGDIVYIGTTLNFNKRKLAHSKQSHNSGLNKWIDNLLSEYIFPKIEVIKIVADEDMFEVEKQVINQYKEKGYLLFNNKHNATGHVVDIPIGVPFQIHADKLASFKTKVSRFRTNIEDKSIYVFSYSTCVSGYFTATRTA